MGFLLILPDVTTLAFAMSFIAFLISAFLSVSYITAFIQSMILGGAVRR